ncbi:hypothetical protein [Myroides odoratimimus]|uniref:hypothetical protein n=1 Tax=Myroides odoratimimus TaxID=76832 RepID=UPI000468430C|nr:hypothetical protein [Myroides odoratimimus]
MESNRFLFELINLENPFLRKIQRKQKNEKNYSDELIIKEYNPVQTANPNRPFVIEDKDGIETLYFWGANDEKLILEVKNIKDYVVFAPKYQMLFLNLLQLRLLVEQEYSSDNEKKIDEKLKVLRKMFSTLFPNSLVTTYSYKPLIGLTKKCDFKENCEIYEYDKFNRLEYIKDNKGNIIQEFKYNYKNN